MEDMKKTLTRLVLPYQKPEVDGKYWLLVGVQVVPLGAGILQVPFII